MLARPFSPAERMTDVFDRAATLNFTTVATVRGPLSQAQLEQALRCLERRHPLLTARIERESESWSLIPGEAAPIPLIVREGGLDKIKPVLDKTLSHREWDNEGPRGELTWLRHGPEHCTLLLCLHHTVSDGSSGIIAMRDLLAFIDHPAPSTIEELPAPGQDDFFPPFFAEVREQFLASLQQPPPARGPAPFRLRTPEDVPFEQRAAKTMSLRLDQQTSDNLAQNARRIGATVHGVLCAALSLALAAEPNATPLQTFAHPVTLRRYLKEYFPETPEIGDAVGCYVSNVITEHTFDTQRSMEDLAQEFSLAVRKKKDAHEPLLASPLRGPLVAQRAAKLGFPAFRSWTEQKIFLGSCALSNLGKLEKLGAKRTVGALQVEDFYFAVATSIMGAFCGAAVSFRGRISLHLTYVDPLISLEVMERIHERTRAHLEELAAG